MAQIIIKTDDPQQGVRTETFTSRADAEAYMDSIGLTIPVAEEQLVEPSDEVKPVPKPVEKPVAKHAKAKKR